MRRQFIFLLVLAGSLLAAGCGEESDSSAKGDVKEYCEVTRSIFRGQEAPPSDAEMDRWEAAAPHQITGDVKTAAGAYRDLNNTSKPDFGKLEQEPIVGSFDRIESFNEDKCGIKPE